ncbi:MAG: hypothetical protein J4215_05395 [Candidatus Diapherotrites archaeon]|uniref:DUF296 domain-containing protein n=1 Tax=Candidatus Iainarchaeum sp. TaxID=3101447 RepID=A0A8T4L8W4_9ARCH|nr:hypothetical protein [Candidatus Diapherotrites archaeon]
MTTSPESMLWTKNATKRILQLVFDENDDVLKCLETAMIEHNIHEVTIIEATGNIKSGIGNYLLGSRLFSYNFDNTRIKMTTGHFKRSKDGLFGVLKIIPQDDNNHVTIAKAIAGPDLELKVSYYEF